MELALKRKLEKREGCSHRTNLILGLVLFGVGNTACEGHMISLSTNDFNIISDSFA